MITLQNNGIQESQMEHLKAEERLNNHISFFATAEYEPGVF